MAETFKYTREWTDEKAFPLLGFSRDWNNPEDYPTVETDERKVREDMQSLHDEVKNYLNETLIPAVIAEEATVEDWAHAESLRVEAETARVAAEEARAEAETARVAAETARVAAETARVAAETTRANAESARVIAEQGRATAETARVDAEANRVSAEAERAHEATGYVARSSVYANNAEVYAEGGSLKEIVETDNGPLISTAGAYTRGAKQYADDSKIYAQGGMHSLGGAAPMYVVGSQDYADKAKAYAESGSYKSAGAVGAQQTVTVAKGAKQYAEEAKQYATGSEQSATAASASAVTAEGHANTARTQSNNASKSATSAESYAAQAKSYAENAHSAVTAAGNQADLAHAAASDANNSRAAALSAQVAAEKARDEAQAAVGGDFVTHPELEEALEGVGGVLVATYNSTTYEEVESAYLAGKMVCFVHQTRLFALTKRSQETVDGVKYYYFQFICWHTDAPKQVILHSGNGWSSVTNATHASTHATGGTDPITPESIGAASTAYVDEKVAGVPQDMVRYTAQSLTEGQQAQARKNIGAVASWADLPDKPFGIEFKRTVIAETQLTGTYDSGSYGAILDTSIVTGNEEILAIVFDGVSYSCAKKTLAGVIAYGNLSLMGLGEDTGEPFLFVNASASMGMVLFMMPDGEAHTVSVSEMGIKKIDNAYIPVAVKEFYSAAGETYLFTDPSLTVKAKKEDIEAVQFFFCAYTLNGAIIVRACVKDWSVNSKYAAVTLIDGNTRYTAEYTPT